MKKGIFITIEGTDGCGKSTQIPLISEYLKEKGITVNILREPGGTFAGEKIREILLYSGKECICNETEVLLYAAARAQIVDEKIVPFLENGEAVICDRFIDSSLAYQGFGRKIDISDVLEINKIAMKNIWPDITFFIDISPEEAIKRRKNESAADRIEQEGMEFHRRVYEGFRILADRYPERIKIIDGHMSVEQTFKNIKHYLEEML